MMKSYLIKRLVSGVGILLCVLLLGIWMIDQIPGDHTDYYPEEYQAETLIPTKGSKRALFYWSFLTQGTQHKEFSLKWNGLNNTFHQTLSNYLSFNFGNSSIDGLAVLSKFKQAFPWSVAVQLPAILLLLGLGVWISIESTLNDGRWYIRWMDRCLLVFNSVPGFWLATLLLFFFANASYFKWFPTGMQSINNKNPFYCWFQHPDYFFLPLMCLVLPSLAYLVHILRNGLKESMESPFWIKSISTGVSPRRALFSEALPQASIPLAGWAAGILPALFSGSVIIEQIFSIPGLGRLLYLSIYARDWPVVQFLFIFSAALTILGFIAADFMIRILDPRIKSNSP